MQTRFNWFQSSLSVGLQVLLFSTLLATGLPSLAACIRHEAQVERALKAQDFKALEKLLPLLNREKDCSVKYLEGVKRSTAQIAATKAKKLVQQGQFKAALALLKRAPTMVWETQNVHGNIAMHRKQWQMAADFVNQSLDLIDDSQATPKAPKKSVIEHLYRLAQQLQRLVGGGSGKRGKYSGEAISMIRDQVRDVVFKKHLLPIQFKVGGTQLSKEAQKSVQQLAAYLEKQRVVQVTLIGHTDAKGSREVNKTLSEKRAESVKKSLQEAGVTAKILTIGKGEDEPLQLADSWELTPTQIDTLNRRVEFEYR